MSNLSDTNAVDFDPFMQDVSFRGPDGQSILVNVKDIDSYYLYSVRSAITFGAQMGACIIMAVVLVAFTSRSSMRKPLFALNLASLVLGFLRSLFLALYTVSPWIEFYANFSGDMSQVTAIHYSNSIAGTIFPLLMVISVNTSLVLQAHAVCVQLNHKALRIPLFLTSVVIVLLAIGFRVAICITNIHSILHADFYGPYYLRSAALITSTIGIWWFTGIFLAKLCYTIWMRKQMGWKSMTAFHTLVIAGGCTMIVPCKLSKAGTKHDLLFSPFTDQQQLFLRFFNTLRGKGSPKMELGHSRQPPCSYLSQPSGQKWQWKRRLLCYEPPNSPEIRPQALNLHLQKVDSVVRRQPLRLLRRAGRIVWYLST